MRGTEKRGNWFTNLFTQNRYLKKIFDKQNQDYITERKKGLAYNAIRNGFSDRSNNRINENTFYENLKNEIENIYETLKDRESLSTITTHSFYPFTQNVFITSKNTNKKIKHLKSLTDMFYESYIYMEPFDIEIEYGQENLIDFWVGSNFDGKDIEKLLQISTKLGNAIMLRQNYNIAIQGEIGVGKTTLLTKIMRHIVQHSISDKLAVYKIDFEEFALDIIKENQNITFEYIQEIILNKINNEKTLQDKQSFVLFIDNLDIIYQRFCERYFIYNDHSKFKDILSTLLEALKTIKFKEKFHFVTYIALREESVKVLKNYEQQIGNINNNNEINNVDMLISINNITSNKIKNIIIKRLKLLEDTLRKTDISKEILEIISENIKGFKNTKIDFNELANISTEGLRHTVHLFSKISLSILSEEYFQRFMIDGYYIKKLHFLGEDLFYSQVNKGVFNIFLNNASYREYWCKNTHEKYPKQLYQLSQMPHMHTYWLKYFILLYLYNNLNKKYISLKELLFVFAPEDEDSSYEENIVRLVLLGLAEVDHGRLIDIKLSKQEEILGFSLSSRAKFILEEIIWSFDYLAVIVEDKWLEIPNIIREKVKDFDKNINGYCLIKSKEDFVHKQREVFISQIKKVFVFLKILELSFEKEKEKVSHSYNSLRTFDMIDFQNNINFGKPNFVSIKRKIEKEILQRAKDINYDRDEIENLIKNDFGITWRVERELENLFEDKYFLKDKDYLLIEGYFENIKKQIKDIIKT